MPGQDGQQTPSAVVRIAEPSERGQEQQGSGLAGTPIHEPFCDPQVLLSSCQRGSGPSMPGAEISEYLEEEVMPGSGAMGR